MSNSILDVVELSNGHKQLTFKFASFLPSGLTKDMSKLWSDEEKSEMADTLLDYLSLETNLNELDKSAEYRKVLKKLMFISMGDQLPLSKEDEDFISLLDEEITINQNDGEILLPPTLRKESPADADDIIPGEEP